MLSVGAETEIKKKKKEIMICQQSRSLQGHHEAEQHTHYGYPRRHEREGGRDHLRNNG